MRIIPMRHRDALPTLWRRNRQRGAGLSAPFLVAFWLFSVCWPTASLPAASPGFSDAAEPFFRAHCTACHGEAGDAAGDIDLTAVRSPADLVRQPELLAKVMRAIDTAAMPPDTEPPVPAAERSQAVAALEPLLEQAVAALLDAAPGTPIRRMTRLQFNNAVRDLFGLTIDVFPLPERMLREWGAYFDPAKKEMPAQVTVFSRPLGKDGTAERTLAGVLPFAQDLRSEHGFDTQGDHLTMSPLLLESLLTLGTAIVTSTDFKPEQVGVWGELFAAPEGDAAAVESATKQRLERLLARAFRRPAPPATVDRYVKHVAEKLAAGVPYPEAMKSAAAAAIASPAFVYLDDHLEKAPEGGRRLDAHALAARLAFFLWGGLPDDELRARADDGTIHDPEVLARQVDRMLDDRRAKRFCDAFATQWLQLERIIPAQPDPETYPNFYFHEYRASMHMMLEPLLLFETVLVENRPVTELVDSDFSYRSHLLEAWYRGGEAGNGEVSEVGMKRVPVTDRRQGGVITSAAVLTMTSAPKHTRPITRGAWLATVILADPPPPPPADVPPLAEEPPQGEENLTIRERFARHREDAACASCHQRIDPLGFALENYDAAGVWRDEYENGRPVDASGTLFGRRGFDGIIEFKDALLAERDRFVGGFASHLLAFATGRETGIEDTLALDAIVAASATTEHRFRDLLRHVVLSESFRR